MCRLSAVPEWVVTKEARVCLFCGDTITRGGYWDGYNGHLIVCEQCIPKLATVAAEAWEDFRGTKVAYDGDKLGLGKLVEGWWYGLACCRKRKLRGETDD